MNDQRLCLTLGHLTAGPAGAQSAARVAYLARFVRAGAVKRADGTPADITIQPEALQRAAERRLFDHKPVFLNHAGFLDSPDLGRLVGRTGASARFNADEQAVEGRIELLDTPAGCLARTILADLLAHPGPDIGLSIVFYPVWAADPPNRLVTGITHVESVDLVFQPAADGRILQALSAHFVGRVALGRSDHPTYASRNDDPAGRENIPTYFTSVDTQSTKGTPSMTPPTSADPSAQAWLDALADSTAQTILAQSGLPETARQRLAAQRYVTPAELQSAIDAERAYLARFQEDQVIHIGGSAPRSPQVSGMRTSLDRIGLALDALLSGASAPSGVQPLTGVRELYHLLSGDYEMTGMFQPERIQFANVNSSTMANLVANVLNKRVAQEFQNYNMWWQPIVVEEDFQSLQQIKWTVLGGVGELPTVAEGAAYTELSWDDSAETGTFVKKGGYLGLTLESIDKDETGRLRGAPRALAQAAWLTLSKAISNIFTAASGVGPTLADSVALFDASGHANLGTAALSLSAWNAARLAMRKQTELNSGQRLGALTSPKFLLVPPDLEMTALQVLATESDYTYALSNGQAAPVNPNAQGSTFDERLNIARRRVIVVDLWTDTNDWAAVADPRLYSTIGVGYRYGRAPEIFSIASPTAGLMFTNDTMPVKVRFFFAVAPIDYRGLYKANVTGG